MILDDFYQQLIKITLKENKKTNIPNLYYSKTYYQTNLPFIDDRILNIRYIKIPTFKKENKQYYYTIFINDIEYWRAGEKQKLYQQIIETFDRYDVDSYTIFQFGKYYGHNDPVINNLMKHYHIYVFNKNNPTNSDTETIYRFISNFLQKRIDKRKDNTIIFGDLLNEIKRLQDFVDFINSIFFFSYNVISNSKKDSFNIITYNNKRRRGVC